MQPQRRVVVVLFADLAGYTRFCESTDPEEVHLLVRPLMNALRQECLELGGDAPTIEGDGFLAVFGAVRGSEDAPVRALTAAVRMQRLVAERRALYGPDLPRLRVGVNLGEVLVAPSWDASGFSVTGDAVNVGSRLCAAAGEGEVLVASALLPLVPTSLRWSDEAAVEVRNRELPVLARRLSWDGLEVLPDSRRPPSTTAFVGRDELLRQLDAAGGTVLLVGEPGVGKTRCAREWLARQDAPSIVAGCPSFRAGDDAAMAAELARGLPDTWLQEQPPVVVRRLRTLRGDEVDTLEDDLLADQLAALSAVLAAAAPLALLVDDVHWATGVELELLSSLLRTPGLRLVLTSRPDALPQLACPVLQVLPLGQADADALVQDLLPNAPAEVTELLGERAGGVPLFLEQCAQLLLDERTVELTADGAVLREPDRLRRVPTVMRMFVTGRLELLTPREREVLDCAAVTGDHVEPELLRHLCRGDVSDVVESLVQRSLLRWEPGPRTPQLRFRHALVRDVAYDGMTRARRVEQHRAAGDWYSVRLPHGAMAARAAHLEAALSLSRGRGAPDCGLAGDTLTALLAHAHGLVQERPSGALDVVRRAEAVVESFASCALDRLDLDLVLAEVLEVLGDQPQALVVARSAREQAEGRGDEGGLAQALWLEGTAQKLLAPGAARAAFDQAAEVYTRLGDALGVAKVESSRAFVEEGDAPSRIPAAHARAFEAAQRAGDARMSAAAAQMVAFHSLLSGRPMLEQWRGQVDAVSRPDDEAGRSRLLVAQAMVDLQALELRAALEAGREALRLGEEVGVNHVVNNAAWTACDAAVLLGELELAEQLLAGSRRVADARPTDHQRFDTLVSEALLRLRQGRPAEAEAAVAALVGLAPTIGLAYVREALACQAQVAGDRGDFGSVPPLVEAVVAIDRQVEQPFLSLRPRLLRLQCLVSARRRISFSESEALRRESRERGAPAVDAIAVRWLELDDLLKGERPLIELQLPALPDLADARAVDATVQALLSRDWSRLLVAAEEWRSLGTTAWPAPPLLWHAELTGSRDSAEAGRAVLQAVGAPDGLEAELRSQVVGLRSS